jgi:SulP family sulfate permease
MTPALAPRARALLPRRDDLRAMRRNPRRDVIAGVTVAFVALPLALAFGVASGLGARAGLVTAIVAGVLAAVFGGSNLQVSGPTGAMTVVLLPIVADVGATGVLVVGLLAGLVLIVLALVGAGRTMQFVPLPVVEGFTLGIAVIIGLQQVPNILGVDAGGQKVVVTAWNAATTWLGAPQWATVLLTGFVAGSMLLAARFRPGLPAALPAVVLATVAVGVLDLDVPLNPRCPACPGATSPRCSYQPSQSRRSPRSRAFSPRRSRTR